MAPREDPQDAWERMRSTSSSAGRPEGRRRIVRRDAAEPAGAKPSPEERNGAAAAPPEPSAKPAGGSSEDASAGELVKQLTDQTKALVKQELRLAQVELKDKGKKVGIGAGMFGAGGLVAFFGAAALIAAVILGLATAMASWLAAVIVGVLLLAAAGAAAMVGKKKVEQATPPAPEQAIGSVKRDVDTVKQRARS